MPSATPELRAAFPGGSDQAISELKAAGYKLTTAWTWVLPIGHMPTTREWEAIDYLDQEWDFGGIETSMVSLSPRPVK